MQNKYIRTDKINDNWEIRYSQYVGDLTIYDKRIGTMDSSKLRTDIYGAIKVSYDSETGIPYVIELEDAADFIPDIDKKSKNSIINNIKEFINVREREAVSY